MDEIIEVIGGAIGAADSFVWGLPLIVILVGTHLYMTIRTKFIQRKVITAPNGIEHVVWWLVDFSEEFVTMRNPAFFRTK